MTPMPSSSAPLPRERLSQPPCGATAFANAALRCRSAGLSAAHDPFAGGGAPHGGGAPCCGYGRCGYPCCGYGCCGCGCCGYGCCGYPCCGYGCWPCCG